MLYRTRRDTRKLHVDRRRSRKVRIMQKLAYVHTYAVEG